MMNKIGYILLSVALIGVSAAALSKGPPEGNKAEVWHCGCVEYDIPYATAYPEWNLLSVSKNNQGHGKHNAEDMMVCTFGVEDFEVYYRNANDCQEPPQTPPLTDVELCVSTPSEGATCGHFH